MKLVKYKLIHQLKYQARDKVRGKVFDRILDRAREQLSGTSGDRAEIRSWSQIARSTRDDIH